MSARPTVVPKPEESEQPWQWSEARWRGIVDRVRAGKTLRPTTWPNGARCAVALSFDSDHETGELREGGESIGRLSQGQYGNRAGIPRILALMQKYAIPATFYVPAVSAMLYPDEQRRVVAEGHEIGIHGWIHERNSILPEASERDLQMRAADMLEKVSGRRPVGIRTPSWDFSPQTLAITRDMGLLYDSSLMADDDCYELLLDGTADRRGRAAGRMDPRRRGLLQHEPLRLAPPLHAALGRAGSLPPRVRHGLCRGRALPAHHASAHHRPPLAHHDPGGADPAISARMPASGARRTPRSYATSRRTAERRGGAGDETDTSGSAGRGRRGNAPSPPAGRGRRASTSTPTTAATTISIRMPCSTSAAPRRASTSTTGCCAGSTIRPR